MNTTKPKKSPGRPVSFDHDEALDKALNLFWLRGYEGTTMAELTKVMGLNRPSIYAAFGNKDELFQKAVNRYISEPTAFIAEALKKSKSRDAVNKLLNDAADFMTKKNTPPGCMVVLSALVCGKESENIKKFLISCRDNLECALVQRFKVARKNKELPPDTNISELAKYYVTIHQGMAVQAASGATKKELLSIARMAMNAWPS